VFWPKGTCAAGKKCRYAHGESELRQKREALNGAARGAAAPIDESINRRGGHQRSLPEGLMNAAAAGPAVEDQWREGFEAGVSLLQIVADSCKKDPKRFWSWLSNQTRQSNGGSGSNTPSTVSTCDGITPAANLSPLLLDGVSSGFIPLDMYQTADADNSDRSLSPTSTRRVSADFCEAVPSVGCCPSLPTLKLEPTAGWPSFATEAHQTASDWFAEVQAGGRQPVDAFSAEPSLTSLCEFALGKENEFNDLGSTCWADQPNHDFLSSNDEIVDMLLRAGAFLNRNGISAPASDFKPTISF